MFCFCFGSLIWRPPGSKWAEALVKRTYFETFSSRSEVPVALTKFSDAPCRLPLCLQMRLQPVVRRYHPPLNLQHPRLGQNETASFCDSVEPTRAPTDHPSHHPPAWFTNEPCHTVDPTAFPSERPSTEPTSNPSMQPVFVIQCRLLVSR